VIDNGSTDNTAIIAKGLGVTVLNCPIRGKGNAIRFAIPQLDSDYSAMLDADGTYSPMNIIKAIELLKQYDVVVGKRETESMRFYNKCCNIALNLPNLIIFGGKNPDICSGFWCFRTSILKSLELSAEGFTLEADLFTSCYSRRLKLASISIEYRKRLGGESKIRFKDGLKICGVMIKRALQ
jgi:dolichol-phosphate mannosyltransferase